jgi:hypothetical protein
MPPEKNCKGFKLREGQRALVEWLNQNPEKSLLNVQWPGGYGKSIGIALGYKAKKLAGVVDRLLVVVANDTQRMQAVNDFAGDASLVDLRLDGDVWQLDKEPVTYRYSKESRADVFVVTIQGVDASYKSELAFLKSMLKDTGSSWMVAADEYHHYATDRPWGDALKSFCDMDEVAFTMATSATPSRDGTPTIFGSPHLKVTYREGRDQGALKTMLAKHYRYNVEYLQDGEILTFTTDDLRTQINGAKNVDKFEVQNDLRHTSKYIYPLLSEPLIRLAARRDATGKPLQCLVRAAGCEHAKSICQQLRDITEGFDIDWIGTGEYGRTTEDNRRIRAAFCPPKDKNGIRPEPTLDVLVQVGMAGEGFDTVYVAEIIDLAIRRLEGTANETAQFYLRGSRSIPGVDEEHQVCYVNVPSDHPLAGVDEQLMDWLDSPKDPRELPLPPKDTGSPDDISDWPPLPDLETLNELKLVDLIEICDEEVENAFKNAKEEDSTFDLDITNPEHVERVRGWMKVVKNQRAKEESEQERCKKVRGLIDRFAGRLASTVIKKTHVGSYAKHMIGDKKKKVNSHLKYKFGPRNDMTEERLDIVYRYCQGLEDSVRAGEIPSWLL